MGHKKRSIREKGLMLLAGCFIFSMAGFRQGLLSSITEKDTREILTVPVNGAKTPVCPG
jgi:hypothetical protein